MTDPINLWHPIATAHDVPHRHIFQGQMLGREVAVWRADDDFVNVWENRCLHRGVRLSIGTNDGSELTCRYHGWRYANRSAGCTYIPAHPADAPARTICNRTFPVVERYGLVWSGEEPHDDAPTVDVLDAGSPFGLRNLPVHASVEVVMDQLGSYSFQPTAALEADPALDADPVQVSNSVLNDHSIAVTATHDGSASTIVFFVQPLDASRSVIRAVLAEAPAEEHQLMVLRHHARQLAKVVDAAEAAFVNLPAPTPMVAKIEEVPIEISTMPQQSSGRRADLRVTVARKWETAAGIAAFEFVPIADGLPTFQPGAHIDVHLPNGLIRQYSLTNAPGETSMYRIGVKLEAESTGGSQSLHDTVREGDVLAISAPRNNFPLRRDALRTILIAGGIGVTPMLAMAQALDLMELDYELHYFAQGADHLAFSEVRDRLGESVVPHLGLSPDETSAELTRMLADYEHASNVYVCGPGPMLEATRRIAADAGWPDDAVHFEYFKNTTEVDDSSTFEIALARSAVTLAVPAGKTILEVLRDQGIMLPSSCEQGACGTCVATVIEGDPDHQDVHLNNSERKAGDKIMTCVSRSRSDRLVLDL